MNEPVSLMQPMIDSLVMIIKHREHGENLLCGKRTLCTRVWYEDSGGSGSSLGSPLPQHEPAHSAVSETTTHEYMYNVEWW